MKSASEPIDVLDFQFKLQCKLKVFSDDYAEKKACSLLSAASRYGLIFVGCPFSKLQVIQCSTLEEYSSIRESVENYSRRYVDLPAVPLHLSVNCEHTILAVVIEKNGCPSVLFYNVASFVKQNVELLKEVRLSATPGVSVLEINWNPTVAMVFTACKSDNSLSVYEMNGQTLDINELPSASAATCFCWSPKGKQLAVGSKDGKITQYKPDLKAVKIINAPPFSQPHSLISLQWISNYQFIGTFKPPEGSEESCAVILIDAPKSGEPVYTNFYDVCFSSGINRSPQFYMLLEHHWNVLMVASANSMEIGVLEANKDTWNQWSLSDNARAELPLDLNHEETYPIGLAIDTSSSKQVIWGEGTLPPVPYLLILSNKGVLCCFKIINLKPGSPSVTSPAEVLSDLSGLSFFVTNGFENKDNQKLSVQPTLPIFGSPSTTVQNSSQAKPLQSEVKPAPTSAFSFGGNVGQPLNLLVPKTSQNTAASPSTAFKPIQQSSSAVNIFGNNDQKSTAGTKNIFGSLTSSTDLKQPVTFKTLPGTSFSSKPGASTSSSLFGGQVTLTPLGGNPTSASKMGNALLSNIEQTSKIAEVKPNSSINKLIAPTDVKSPVNVTQTSVQKQVTPDTKTEITPTKEVIADETKLIHAGMIQFEFDSFEAELKAFLEENKTKLSIDLTSTQKCNREIEQLEEFVKQVEETSHIQSSEIHTLKHNTLQSWAWLEEARLRMNDNQNNVIEKLKPLNSVLEKHMDSLQKMEYYLNSQLKLANGALDEQWENFQEFCKKSVRIKTPTMEAIFQAMVKQNAVLQKQDYILRDISTRVKSKRLSSAPNLLNSITKSESLEESFNRLHLEPEDITDIFHQKVLKRVKSLTPTKAEKLKELLRNREVSHVVFKPLLDQSVSGTPSRQERILSAPGKEVARTLHFAQSTPILNKTESQIKKIQITESQIKQSQPKDAPSAFVSLSSSVIIDREPLTSTAGIDKFNITKESVKSSVAPVETKTTELKKSGTSTISQTNLFGTTPKTTFSGSNLNSMFAAQTTNQGNVSGQNMTKPNLFSGGTSFNFGASSNSSLFSFGKSSPPVLKTPLSSTSNSQTSISQNTLAASTNSTFKTTSTVVSTNSTITVKNIISSPFSSAVTSKSSAGDINNAIPNVSTATSDTSSSISAPSKLTSQSFNFGSVNLSSKPTTFSFGSSVSNNLPVKTDTVTTSVLDESSKNISSTSALNLATTNTSIFGKAISTSSIPVNSTNSVLTSTSSSVITVNIFEPSTSATTTKSIFGSATTSSGSVFQGTSSTTPATITSKTTVLTSTTSTAQSSVFGTQSQSSIFSKTPNTTTATSTPTTLTSSIFGKTSSAAPLNATSPSNLTSTTTSITTTTSSIFGTTSGSEKSTFGGFGSNSSIFGTSSIPATTETFNASTSSTSIFGTSAQTMFGTATTTQSIFGQTPTTTGSFGDAAKTQSVFGSTSSNTSVFGTANTFGSATTSGSIFGTATTSQSVFSTPVLTQTASVFGNSQSLFGNAKTTQSTFSNSTNSPFSSTSTPFTQNSVFGQTPTTSAFGSTSNFGSPVTSSASPFGKSVFGQQSSFGTTQSGFGSFGTAPASTANSLFGQSNTFGGTSVFGSPASSTANVFGSSIPTSNVFGNSTTTSNVFGSPTTTSNVFGGPTTTSNVFGNSTTTSNVFGGSTTTSNVFGSPTSTSNVFGSPTTSSAFGSSSVFGTSNTSTFGQNTSGNVFGSSQSNTFGTPTSTASFGFGGLNVGSSNNQSPFGKPADAKSIFGGKTSTFGSTNTSSIFGNQQSNSGFSSSGSVFGQPAFGNSSFGSQPSAGPFSNTNQSIAQTGFGSSNAFQKPASGFGSAPSFGGAPAFGGAPTFGGSATFGSGSAFGSPEKVFGGGAAPQASTGFGGSSSFANLANQNTVGFGNLAQQAPGMNQTPFSGAPSFSNWR